VSNGALVIGGTLAGIQAAQDLADSGISVHLVESTPFLGKNLSASFPEHLITSRMLEIAKHPKITVWTNTQVERTGSDHNRFRVTLRQHPRYIDLTKCTACGDCVEVCPVSVPGTDHKAVYLPTGSQPGCAAIDKQGTPPCTQACPGGIHVQGYVALTTQGRFQEAFDLIQDAIPFPGICGRVCMHPCEINCRRGEVDTPVSIRLLKRFVSDWVENEGCPPPELKIEYAPDAKRVAVVGSGPAGMTVADRLARSGHRITVYEKLPVIAGMMAVGIPAYRLPRDVIAREYRRIKDLGVEIRLNTAIGPGGDYSVDDLFDMGFNAVCLAVGAHNSLSLHIPGEDIPGVVHGIELLRNVSIAQQLEDASLQAGLDKILFKGENTRAAVLGGGNTAMDAARTLKRMGLKDVRILYRRSRAEMPALPEEIEEAEAEGVAIEYLTAPVRIQGNEKFGVGGLACIRMELTEPDESGRRRPVPIPGSEFRYDLDLVVLAIGQVPDIDGEDKITLTRQGRIRLADSGFMTSRSGVFAAGDAVTLDKIAVIEAIGMGKQAAEEIDGYLKGLRPDQTLVETHALPVSPRELLESEKTFKPRVDVPTLSVNARLAGYDEVELGYDEDQATKEASRCLACGPCSECLACVSVCKPGAIVHQQNETVAELNIGSVLFADDPELLHQLPFVGTDSLHIADPDNPSKGSAAAAKAMYHLFAERQGLSASEDYPISDDALRIGVFVCRCGEQIANIVDTEALCERAALWPDVTHVAVLDHSCSSDAAEAIRFAVSEHQLNRVVLAACSCCAVDQVCFSCTFQRVRCKQNLGVFERDGDLHSLSTAAGLPPHAFVFVNIREQCAWVHTDNPNAATSKATALIASATANARSVLPQYSKPKPISPSVLILGSGQASLACRGALNQQGIPAEHLESVPDQIEHTGGIYKAFKNGRVIEATGIVIAPQNAGEWDKLISVFGTGRHQLRFQQGKTGIVARQPGIFLCDPKLEMEASGNAAAARMAAWLGIIQNRSWQLQAKVDTNRCRACNTCVDTCEIGAPEILCEGEDRYAWIDPTICTGCSSCAARCPSGAITAGSSSDRQLEEMIDALLS